MRSLLHVLFLLFKAICFFMSFGGIFGGLVVKVHSFGGDFLFASVRHRKALQTQDHFK